MADTKLRDKAKKLREKLLDADYRYYTLANPDIDDFTYDKMMKELQELEAKYPELVSEDSPTQRVGSGKWNEFPSVRHGVPMLSLANSYDVNDLIEIDMRLKNLTEGA